MGTDIASLPLYALADELRESLSIGEDTGGELTDEQVAYLDALELAFPEKVERVVMLLRERRHMQQAARAEADHLRERARRFGASADALLAYLLRCFQASGRDCVRTPLVTVHRQRASVPAIRWAGPPESIPGPYRVVETVVKPDQKKVIADWKAGTLPDGFEGGYSEYLKIS